MRKNSIGKEIILMLAAGSVLSLAAILSGPNVLKIIKALKRDYNRLSKQKIKDAIRQLERKKIIELQKDGYETYIKLTKDGQRQILKYKLGELKFGRVKKWDGKWRIIVFDIPEKFRKARQAVSFTLRKAGAYQFQKSVFVYPDDCEDDIRFVAGIYGVRPFVKFIEAGRIDNEPILKRHFEIYV